MRIPIREQLGLLVLITSLTALGVLAIATWVQNYNFVVNIRLSGLSLTASLKAAQLSANLLLFQTSITAISTRILIQNALQRYNEGNNTDDNWSRAVTDLQGALAGNGQSALLLQAIIFPKNDTGIGNLHGLLHVTGEGIGGTIPLPYTNPNGSTVFLGDPGLGYPPSLYPNLTFTTTVVNSTYNISNALFEGRPLTPDSTLVLGPFDLNETASLMSLSVAIDNNTSRTDILGWLTVVLDARMIYNIVDSAEGLDTTGEVLLVGPTTPNNKFPAGVRAGIGKNTGDIPVQFKLPPQSNSTFEFRHSSRSYPNSSAPFAMRDYPAVLDAFDKNNHAINNAGSMISSINEEGKSVSVGYAVPSTTLVDWVLVFEQSHGEVVSPINHLRNVLLACVFGTTGLILLFLLPIAHFSVRPIRRLREATQKTVEPYIPPSECSSTSSIRSRMGDENDGAMDEESQAAAKKEEFMWSFSRWRRGRTRSKAERRDANRRQTFRIPGKVQDRKHYVHDELTDLTRTFNEMSEELVMQYERLEERVRERTHELELSKKAAEAANESKTLFIANISHELKTPLNGILGMCAVCMQEEDQTKIRRSLQIIYKSGDLLLHLLTDLLTFSKNQIGQQLSLDEKEFRLADISSQISSIFDKQAKEGPIDLRVKFQGPRDAIGGSEETEKEKIYGPYGTGRVKDMIVWGDQHRILQVLINLVSNSLKFTPSGGSIEVRIKCLGEEEEKTPSKAGSRKGSLQSKQSKQSRQHSGTRRRPHASHSGSDSSITPIPPEANGVVDTTLTINVMGTSKQVPQVAVRERSVSPPPLNAKTLVFEFDVEDTGPGIPESQQQRIFEPFVQGDLGLSKKYGGTGLGLSICAQLAGLMCGNISLNSQEGRGSTFSMRIPLRWVKERADSTTSSHVRLHSRPNSLRNSISDDLPRTPQRMASDPDLSNQSAKDDSTVIGFDTPAKPRLVGLSQPFFATSTPMESPKRQIADLERAAAEASQKGTKLRVLVAEDNEVNQEVVRRMLKLEEKFSGGIEVEIAQDGQEALEMVRQSMDSSFPPRPIHLVLMDVQMPNLDGIQSTRRIRELGFSAPIVALSAFSEEDSVRECLDSGMDFFLPKPIRRPALKHVLKKYCATIPEVEEAEPQSPTKTEILEENHPTNGKMKNHEDEAVSPTS